MSNDKFTTAIRTQLATKPQSQKETAEKVAEDKGWEKKK
jgi:hypothetical protein